MDGIDRRILEALKENGRATASDIGKAVKLSVPAVTERMRKLQETGVIERYTVRINRKKAGYGLCAVAFVNLRANSDAQAFESDVIRCPEVVECHRIAGAYGYLLKVLSEDTAELDRFLCRRLKAMPGVEAIHTMVVLSTLKEAINR